MARKPVTEKELVKKEEQLDLSVLDGMNENGFEETTSSDFVLPFLNIIQTNSPELEEDNPNYVPRAKVGHLLNKATGILYEEIIVIPAYYKKCEVEWTPRLSGGGFVAQHDIGTELVREITIGSKGERILKNGNELQTTAYFYCVVCNEAREKIVISMTSTKLKIARQIMTKARALRIDGREIPLFAQRFLLTTVTEKNSKGTWKNFHAEYKGLADSIQFASAIQFRDLIAAGDVTIKPVEEETIANPEDNKKF